MFYSALVADGGNCRWYNPGASIDTSFLSSAFHTPGVARLAVVSPRLVHSYWIHIASLTRRKLSGLGFAKRSGRKPPMDFLPPVSVIPPLRNNRKVKRPAKAQGFQRLEQKIESLSLVYSAISSRSSYSRCQLSYANSSIDTPANMFLNLQSLNLFKTRRHLPAYGTVKRSRLALLPVIFDIRCYIRLRQIHVRSIEGTGIKYM